MMKDQGAPACFTQRQWDEWRQMARLARPASAGGYCEDCSYAYKLKMQAQGRCKHERTVFIVVRGAERVGIRNPDHRQIERAVA